MRRSFHSDGTKEVFVGGHAESISQLFSLIDAVSNAREQRTLPGLSGEWADERQGQCLVSFPVHCENKRLASGVVQRLRYFRPSSPQVMFISRIVSGRSAKASTKKTDLFGVNSVAHWSDVWQR